MTLDEALKKLGYSEKINVSLLRKLHEVADLVNDYPNDQELGREVRKLFG